MTYADPVEMVARALANVPRDPAHVGAEDLAQLGGGHGPTRQPPSRGWSPLTRQKTVFVGWAAVCRGIR
jgi:hypothetical protein